MKRLPATPGAAASAKQKRLRPATWGKPTEPAALGQWRVYLEIEIAETRMVVRATTLRPVEQPLVLADRQIIDAGMAHLHQPVFVELPVFVAVGAVPLTVFVMPFVGKAHGDAVVVMGPEFLDQAVLLLALPLAGEEVADLLAAARELAAVAPLAVGGMASATRSGSRLFQPSSAMRTFCAAVSRVKGGKGGRASGCMGVEPSDVEFKECRRRSVVGSQG